MTVDLAGNAQIDETPGDTGFLFTESAHRELCFDSEDALREYLSQHVLPSLSSRLREVTKPQMRAYVNERRVAKDPEWSQFLLSHQKW